MSSITTQKQPKPPAGYSSLQVSPSQILLSLTISNKCGQAFRWRRVDVYEPIEKEIIVKKEEDDDKQLIKLEETNQYVRTTEWSMCLSDRVVFVRQDEERGYIYFKTILGKFAKQQDSQTKIEEQTAVWLQDYLNLSVPLESLYEEWSEKDPVFSKFAKRFTGVRMLRQDPWETLCAFICSSNNNIARIGQMVQNLCTNFTKPILTVTYPPPPASLFAGDGDVQFAPTTIVYHPFPPVERLAGKDVEAKLRSLSFGYRAPYIRDTAQKLLDIVKSSKLEGYEGSTSYENVDQYLHSLRLMDYHSARQELVQFSGVGPKVADCILLMAMDQPSSIPVDRHVFQFAERWYKIRTKGGNKGYEHIADTFRQLWGPFAGWAHSVLFTADLRAFQTYKVEVIDKVEMKAESIGSLEPIPIKKEVMVKEEEMGDGNTLFRPAIEEDIESNHTEEPVDTARTVRWKKRVYDNHVEVMKEEQEGSSQGKITKSFKGVKRSKPLEVTKIQT